MNLRLHWFACGLAASLFVAPVFAGPAYDDPAKTDADFPLQGEYEGTVKGKDGDKKLAVQVIARGKGKFEAVGYTGGLPGAGWDPAHPPERVTAEAKSGAVVFEGKSGKGTLRDGKLTVQNKEGAEIGVLSKIERKSPTIGAEPPKGAVVLFDGKSADQFEGGKATADGLLVQGCTSKKKFGKQKLHVEFRLPYMPEDGGQGRGNSGVYLQGRYEVQVLDSFGLKGENNECGGIYSVKAPDVNACLPPLAWQTYDIEYTPAGYEGGKVVSKPKMTVHHNGILIHRDVELPADRGTTAAPNKPGPDAGPLYLQDHGNPVRYRNIWVVEQ